MVNEHYAYHSNGSTNTHLHSVSIGNGHSSESTLVQIDPEPLATKPVPVMGQAVDNPRGLLSFRKFPIKSILKNGKVHNSSSESLLGSQPKSGILKRAIVSNGAPPGSLDPAKVSPSSAESEQASSNVSQASAKAAASTVQFRIENATSTAASKEPSVSMNGAAALIVAAHLSLSCVAGRCST